MPKKGFRADPLRNEGDMKVFYCVSSDIFPICTSDGELFPNGLKTSTEIAGALEVKPPTVAEHLKKLENIGFVRKGERRGRSQKYKVNWDKVIKNFFEESGIHEYLTPSWEELHQVEEETKNALEKIKKSKKIQDAIKSYFQIHLPETITDISPRRTLMFLKNPTFYETVSKFESEVAKYKYEEDEIENQEFHELIKRWQDFLTRTHSLEGVAARDAILEKIKLKDAK